MCGASLVITRRVVKVDHGWMCGHLAITRTTSLLLNAVVKGVAITSVLKKLLPPIILFIPTYRPTFTLVSVQETKDLVALDSLFKIIV